MFAAPCTQLNTTIQVYRSGCSWVGMVADIEFSITCNSDNGTWDMELNHAGPDYAIFTQPLAGNPCPPLGAWTLDVVRSTCFAVGSTGTLAAGAAAMPTDCTACSGTFTLVVAGFCQPDGNGTFNMVSTGVCIWTEDSGDGIWTLYHDATWWYLHYEGIGGIGDVFRLAPVACRLCPPLGAYACFANLICACGGITAMLAEP